jgi:hypothetical protein
MKKKMERNSIRKLSYLEAIKQFLKPEIRKICITSLILNIFLILSFYITSNYLEGYSSLHRTCSYGFSECTKNASSITTNRCIEISNYCDMGISKIRNRVYNLEKNVNSLFFVIVPNNIKAPPIPSETFFQVIYYYLLSCLIVWIYDKFRKRK